jgi:hypothetical protein
MISHRPTSVWAQTFKDRLLAVVAAEAEAEAEDSMRLSTSKSGVSSNLLLCCKAILLMYYILSITELRLFNPWFQLLNLRIYVDLSFNTGYIQARMRSEYVLSPY